MADDERRSLTGVARTDASSLDWERVRMALPGSRLGHKFHYFAELASTNSQAWQLAEQGAADGEIVVAEAQSAGRGRLGRQWASPPFANLYLSIVLRPRLAPTEIAQVTLMAAVALADAVSGFIPNRPTIKWPNDILVDGKKLAGILTELACDENGVKFVILGIGVNVNYQPAAMPAAIGGRATSMLALVQSEVPREAFLTRLIQDLDRCYGVLESAGFSALAPRWESYFGLRGAAVKVAMVNETLIGRALGLDRDGALLVEDASGVRQRVLAGDVIPIEG